MNITLRALCTSKIRTAALAFMALAAVLIGATACDENPSQNKIIKIGLVTNNPNGMKNVAGFKGAMEKLGYVEGENVSYISENRPVRGKQLDTTLANFVKSSVDLIFTAGTPTGVAAHRITKGTKIPVVFGVIADPVAAGVMTDLNRPGGNMTGVKLGRSQARRLELFLQIAPAVRKLAILYNANDSAPSSAVAQVEKVIGGLGAELIKLACPNDEMVTKALGNLPQDIDAIFLVPDSVVNKRIKDIVKLTVKRKLPLSGPSTAQIEQGAFMTYGFVHADVGAQAARMAHLIIKGAKPAELPVESAESYLGLNLATSKSIGVEIPGTFLRAAKVVIRTSER